jgi:hypothetical protein
MDSVNKELGHRKVEMVKNMVLVTKRQMKSTPVTMFGEEISCRYPDITHVVDNRLNGSKGNTK